MMNEQTTYAYIGEKQHFVYGEYRVGSHYICVKDHSLLDTQILLIDETGTKNWEHITNFKCDMSPIKVLVHYEYHLDACGTVLPYWEEMVWYQERTDEELIQMIKGRTRTFVEVVEIIREG